jgi:hypothetical protein
VDCQWDSGGSPLRVARCSYDRGNGGRWRVVWNQSQQSGEPNRLTNNMISHRHRARIRGLSAICEHVIGEYALLEERGRRGWSGQAAIFPPDLAVWIRRTAGPLSGLLRSRQGVDRKWNGNLYWEFETVSYIKSLAFV